MITLPLLLWLATELIDDVYLWDRALNEAEIEALVDNFFNVDACCNSTHGTLQIKSVRQKLTISY